MFKTDENHVFSQDEGEEKVVRELDRLAMKIIEGDVDLDGFQIKPGKPRLDSYDGLVIEGPKTMEIEYYE